VIKFSTKIIRPELPGNYILAINIAGAYGTDSPEPFSLGGNNSIFNGPLFGRDTWALPGYNANVQIGTLIQTNSIEYRLPVINIERNWNERPIGVV
jgi:hypothetical protein